MLVPGILEQTDDILLSMTIISVDGNILEPFGKMALDSAELFMTRQKFQYRLYNTAGQTEFEGDSGVPPAR